MKSQQPSRIVMGLLIIILATALVGKASGMEGHDSEAHGDHGAQADADDHGDMHHGSHTDADGTYTHEMMAGGVHAEFQVMSLASMNMSDEAGNTHHIMVKMWTDEKKTPVEKAIGKIKVIAPDGGEQVGTLTDYGSILAANFRFPVSGKYGVIFLTKVAGEKKLFKFWYPHP